MNYLEILLIGGGISFLTLIAIYMYRNQRKQLNEWLIWACMESEKKLQSGTGQLKLREVWNAFCTIKAFRFVTIFISFEKFSELVSLAIVEVKKMLINNKDLATYIYGDNAVNEVAKLKNQLDKVVE